MHSYPWFILHLYWLIWDKQLLFHNITTLRAVIILAFMCQYQVISLTSLVFFFFKNVIIKVVICLYRIPLKKTCMFRSTDVCNFVCRNTQMACSGDCYTSSCSWESGNYYWNLFNHQAVLFIKLFPWSEDCAHILDSAWSDIHTRNQLDADDTLPGCYYWLQRHKALGKCTR